MKQVRVFIVIHLADEVREHLVGIISNLKRLVPARSVRWVPVENIHLTLRFIGDVPHEAVERLGAALRTSLQGRRQFKLRLGQPGCFPNARSPRIVWIGVEGAVAGLLQIHSKITEATRAWGELETRPFRPHLTLGRVKTNRGAELKQISEAVAQTRVKDPVAWTVGQIHLVQSVLGSGGSQYSDLAIAPLADAG